MRTRNHFVVVFVYRLKFYERILINTMLFCLQGCCFSLSALSAESEKKNQLCVLVYYCQALFKKILAENYHVREWAPIKLVGAHDNFSAGY